MKFISLFAGIGGFDLALTRQGHECVWANEWDKYAAQIYDKNFKSGESLQRTERGGVQSTGVESNPEIRGSRQSKSWGYRQLQQSKNFSENTQSLSEVKQNSQGGNGTLNQDRPDSLLFGHSQSTGNRIDTRDIRTVPTEEIPDHDLLVGGFPCQAFSIAGKRKGFDDTRGTLFFEIARILREKKPRLFILENVKGLLSHDNGFTFKTIIATLDELGYDLQWQVLNSKNFGVPQNRERVFIIGNLRGTSRPEVFPITENNSEDIVLPTVTTRVTADSNGTYVCKRPSQEINQLNNPTHSNNRVYGSDGLSPTLNTMQGGNRQPKIFPMSWRRTEKGKEIRKQNQRDGKDYTPFSDGCREVIPNKKKKVIGTITAQAIAKDSLLGNESQIRRLTPIECERLQGFPDGWTAGVSDTQRYKMCGNAVTVNVVNYLVSKL